MAGRTKKEFSIEIFENLCAIQCTEQEICSVLETTDKTLVRWCKDTYGMDYSEVYKQKSAKGKMSLRRYQFNLAKTNAAMAIFLGKQYLGQRDIIGVENETTENARECTSELINTLKKYAKEELIKDGKGDL